MDTHYILVEDEYEGIRIDVFLSKTTGFSRNFFHHLIQRGEVKVQGKIIKKSYRVESGIQIEISEFTRFTDASIFQEAAAIPLEIVCQEKDYLVLYKPAGVLSHPRSIRDLKTPSVTAFLIHHYENLPSQSHFMRA
jgi:23S rRNA pseudouridine1911/1915/1917 synthase